MASPYYLNPEGGFRIDAPVVNGCAGHAGGGGKKRPGPSSPIFGGPHDLGWSSTLEMAIEALVNARVATTRRAGVDL